MTSDNHQRQRTVHWSDPAQAAQATRQMSGLDFFQAMIRGELPQAPIAASLDFRLTEASEGRVVFTVTPAEYHYNPIGSVHGGVPATLLDSAMSCAVHSLLPAGTGYTTVELKVNFIRPIQADTGPLQAIGEAIHVGRRVATAQGRLVDAQGKLYSHGTTTCLIFS